MGFYKEKWHIGLNSKATAEGSKLGYVIQTGTYHVGKQEPKAPRFSSGDQSLQDLSYLSYINQRDFTGGQGQTLLEDSKRFLSVQNINVLSSRGLDDKPLEAGFKLADLITEKIDTDTPGNYRLINWGGLLYILDLDTGVLETWNGSAGTFTSKKAMGEACTNMSIGYTLTAGGFVENIVLIVQGISGALAKFLWNNTEDADTVDYVEGATVSAGYYIFRYAGRMYTIFDASDSGLRIGVAWENRAFGHIPGDVVNAVAIAGDPLQFMIASVDTTTEHSWISTGDGSLSSVQTTNYEIICEIILNVDGVITDMVEWNNTLLYCGYRTNSAGGKTGFIYSYPHNLIFETVADATDRGIYSLHTDDVVYAGASQETGLYAFDVNGFALNSIDTSLSVTVTDILRFKGKLHFITDQGILYEVTNNDYAAAGSLITSMADAGQPLITKMWANIILGIKESLVTDETINVSYRVVNGGSWTALTEWDDSDANLRKEWSLPYNLATDRIQLKVALARGTNSTPTVEQIALGYFPGTTKLRTWKFVITISPTRRLPDESQETSPDVETTRDNLMALANVNEILEFVDKDGTSYDVIVHQFEMDSKSGEEEKGYLATITLFEAPTVGGVLRT